MNKDEKEYIKEWLTKAEHDLIAAKTLIQNRPDISDTVCFHCQQAVEKFFKAYLIYRGVNIMKTHSVTFLQVKCSELDKDFEDVDLRNLDDFAVDIRYPDVSFMPELIEAHEYLQIAERIKELVQRKINLN